MCRNEEYRKETNLKPIITSILDSDLYKFTMQQVVWNQYPNATVAYEFRCRNKGVKLGFLAKYIKAEIEHWSEFNLTVHEKAYLFVRVPFLSKRYIDFLESYRFNPDLVQISDVDGDLLIKIAGPWVDTILFEVPLLATINELYFRHTSKFSDIEQTGKARLSGKIAMIQAHPRMVISEFGTRRRYSKEWQSYVLQTLVANCPQVMGTSNVRLAMDLDIKPVGTMAHEYISAHIALVDNIRQAQKRALHVWQQEYDDNLGIALTDTFTTRAFFMDFDKTLTRSFAGLRHDSGDPFEFGWNAIKHYKNNNIDPRTKMLVFSDGLDVPTAIKIFETFTGLIGVSFGIGTNLTNDLGVLPLNIVIKLIECNGKPVVKLSDVKGKNIGDEKVITEIENAYLE
jgi:nicotinate phosphoribosyltransferase